MFRCTSVDYGQHDDIVQCLECNLVYANVCWHDGALLAQYENVEDPLYAQERHGRELTFRRHLRHMQRVTGPPAGRQLLDIGAYIGVFVDVARRAGWQAQGIEPSQWAVGVARREGLPVMAGTLASAGLQRAAFDVITMWDVVEHFDDPRMELRRTFDLLKPGGVIVLHTIDIGSVTARLMGARWPFLMEMHMVYFSRRTLRQMLESVGFVYHSAHTAGRYLSLGYLAGRLGAAFGRPVGAAAQAAVRALNIAARAVPVNTLGLFTMYARKPHEVAE